MKSFGRNKGFSMQNKKSALIAFLAVLITIGALWFTNRAVTPREATWDDVLAEAKNGGYRLITTSEISERYQKDAKSILLVIPARSGNTGQDTLKGR